MMVYTEEVYFCCCKLITLVYSYHSQIMWGYAKQYVRPQHMLV